VLVESWCQRQKEGLQLPFHIFERKAVRRGIPSVTATKLGRLAINKTATRPLEKNAVEFVLLLWDNVSKKFAIRPISKRDPRAYRVSYGVKGNGAGFSAKTFLDYIGFDYSSTRSLPATWNSEHEQLEVDVPPEFLKDSQQKKLIEMDDHGAVSKRATSR
jgi:hypothetical protein